MDCLFCSIIKGEIPSTKVYEDEQVYAFKDINPMAPVHVLIIPKTHLSSINDVTEENSAVIAHIYAVAAKLAKKCEIQLSYAIGVAKPVSVFVETFGTGTVSDEILTNAVNKVFDLRPAAIIKNLKLDKPIYTPLSAYGHMGREDLGVSWEKTDKIQALLDAVN